MIKFRLAAKDRTLVLLPNPCFGGVTLTKTGHGELSRDGRGKLQQSHFTPTALLGHGITTPHFKERVTSLMKNATLTKGREGMDRGQKQAEGGAIWTFSSSVLG